MTSLPVPRRLQRHAALVAGITALAPAVALTAGPSGAAVSGNLLTGPQASFDGGYGTWDCAGSCALADVNAPVHSGTGALAVTSVGADEWLTSGPVAGAKPGTVYTGSVAIEAGSTGRTAVPLLVFYDGSGAKTGSAWGQAETDTTTWSATMPVTGIAPPNTVSVALGLYLTGAPSGEVHYLDDASVTGRSGVAPAIAGPLTTKGNQILDAYGHPVVLRGLNRYGATIAPANFPTDAEIGEMRAWGANFVRLPLAEHLWLNTCPNGTVSNDPNYPASVDAAVRSITSRGMVALVDLHFNVISACGPGGPQQMADAAYAPTFWRQVAARYRSNPLVAFDLYNEPHDISDSVWLNGGTVPSGTNTFQAAGMQQLYNTVRAQRANNLVFVGGQNWATQPSTTPVSGVNIVNAAHAYTCPSAPIPANCVFSNIYDPAQLLDRWLPVKNTRPVVVTEFGWPATDNGTYAASVVSYAAQQGWGWSAWAWDGHTTGMFDMLADTTNYEPTASGMPILAGLGANVN